MDKSKYKLRDSPFFRLRSKAKLAQLLHISLPALKRICELDDAYIRFQKPKKSGGNRDISAPIPPLKAIQSRIADLFSRVAPPDYLFSPVQGRSYVDNAAGHQGANSVRLLDIDNFFPSCSSNKVVWFFRSRMECSSDVAHMLSRIVTLDGALPQGSPCSPILAYFCYIDMWEEIEELVSKEGCKLSVYVDDLTISGDSIPEKMIWELKKTLRRHGHSHSHAKERSKYRRPVEITGVIVSRNGITVPNRQRQKISQIRRELKTETSPELVSSLEAQLRGRLTQLHQVKAGNKG